MPNNAKTDLTSISWVSNILTSTYGVCHAECCSVVSVVRLVIPKILFDLPHCIHFEELVLVLVLRELRHLLFLGPEIHVPSGTHNDQSNPYHLTIEAFNHLGCHAVLKLMILCIADSIILSRRPSAYLLTSRLFDLQDFWHVVTRFFPTHWFCTAHN